MRKRILQKEQGKNIENEKGISGKKQGENGSEM